MESKHTKEKWYLENTPKGTGKGIEINIATDNRVIATMVMDSYYDRYKLNYSKEQEANAAYIVKACNAHEELVKALQEGLYDMKEWRDYCVMQVESFEGNERQLMIDLARDVTKRIENAESILQKVNDNEKA